MEETAVERAMAIAKAYRDATEADTVALMNAQSNLAQHAEGTAVFVSDHGQLEPLHYYLVSATWMHRAWKTVLKPPQHVPENWSDIVGEIDNSALLQIEPESQIQQSAGVSFVSKGGSGTNEPFVLRKDLTHEQDFYFLGSRAWLLFSSKFGYTQQCKAVVRAHKTRDSSLAVDLHDARPLSSLQGRPQASLVPVPATGRFPYEHSLDAASASDDGDAAMMQNPQEDESGGGMAWNRNMPNNNHRQFPNMIAASAARAANERQQVSDDSDTGGTDQRNQMKDTSSDGVPEDDDISSPGVSQQSVILLPPSTTTTTGNQTTNSLYSPMSKARGSTGSTPGTGGLDEFGYATTGQEASSADDYWAMDNNAPDPAPMHYTTTLTRYRYGSGLGNLGNTCFMNSTLQCLGHTRPLQKYFLSGEFKRDLNRVNPLGTGGELASVFAKLLTEMWGEESTTVSRVSSVPKQTNEVAWAHTTSNVVYPREFKITLGKHAEQFMGYDQHDSQEFATYLLDALHEDTNRVTKKPYIEKPEQADGESDEEAASKAWSLHLQRENSKVLENFMGQVKSRVQCSEPGCGRVSTTFDPFMYLSVPIPGSSDRTFKVHYVPFDPSKRIQALLITLPKMATMHELGKRVQDHVLKLGIETELNADDLAVADVWQKEIYTWYSPKDEVDRIRDIDETFLFALRPAAEIQAQSAKDAANGDNELDIYNIKESGKKRYQLDLPTMTRLNVGDNWTNELAKYLQNHLSFLNAFNPTKGSTDARVKLFQRTTSFLELCYKDTEDLDVATSTKLVNEDEVPALSERCDASPIFENVKSLHDLAVLEFCAAKMRAEILRLIRAKKNESSGGIRIAIRHRTPGVVAHARPSYICGPLVLRIPANMTVYALREELASRLSRSLRRPGDANTQSSSGQATSESEAARLQDETVRERAFDDGTFGSPDVMIMRQIPLTYDRKNPTYSHKSYDNSHQLGSLETGRGYRSTESSRGVPLANAKDPEESHIVAHIVGDQGTVTLEWPTELVDRAFDTVEYDTVDDPSAQEEGEPRALKSSKEETTVLDCIEKYCQMEQLEETEMWYCNRCKKHVRAWKQFHLYRTPPLLIVHLKRFQYSATTHRRDKISKFIDFPLEGLDLTKHVMHWASEEEPIYDCYAVSNHFGGLGGGHYTAYALNDDGVWCNYDDSRVHSHVEKSSILSDAAYVLYYRRRDVACDEDFLLNLQTPEQAGPAIISDLPDPKLALTSSEASGSNAAVVDDDNMEVEDTVSHSTTAMGSMDGVDEFNNYGADDRLPDDDDRLPRQ